MELIQMIHCFPQGEGGLLRASFDSRICISGNMTIESILRLQSMTDKEAHLASLLGLFLQLSRQTLSGDMHELGLGPGEHKHFKRPLSLWSHNALRQWHLHFRPLPGCLSAHTVRPWAALKICTHWPCFLSVQESLHIFFLCDCKFWMQPWMSFSQKGRDSVASRSVCNVWLGFLLYFHLNDILKCVHDTAKHFPQGDNKVSKLMLGSLLQVNKLVGRSERRETQNLSVRL